MAISVSLIYISLLALSSLASCTLHKAVKIISAREAASFSGFVIVVYLSVFLATSFLLIIFNRWIVFFFTESIIYAAPLIALVFLLYRARAAEGFNFEAPKVAAYFSDALFGKFMLAAFLMLLVDMFHDGSYYGGGTYSNIFTLWGQISIFIMPVIAGIIVIILVGKNLWFPAFLITAMLICFGQGLILFVENSENLAVAYAISSSMTSSCPLILAFMIPVVYCVQRRSGAFAVTGAISFWLSGTVLNILLVLISFKLGSLFGLTLLIKPAVTFTLSLILIAYLFYLFNENNQVYIADLISEFKQRDVVQINETVSMADQLEGLDLAPREKEVCALLLKGLSVRMISGELGLAFNTVNNYYRSLYRKLGISSKGELFMRFGAQTEEQFTMHNSQFTICSLKGATSKK
jgi:DNA-binding CsgD family transcriptional regulator